MFYLISSSDDKVTIAGNNGFFSSSYTCIIHLPPGSKQAPLGANTVDKLAKHILQHQHEGTIGDTTKVEVIRTQSRLKDLITYLFNLVFGPPKITQYALQDPSLRKEIEDLILDLNNKKDLFYDEKLFQDILELESSAHNLLSSPLLDLDIQSDISAKLKTIANSLSPQKLEEKSKQQLDLKKELEELLLALEKREREVNFYDSDLAKELADTKSKLVHYIETERVYIYPPEELASKLRSLMSRLADSAINEKLNKQLGFLSPEDQLVIKNLIIKKPKDKETIGKTLEALLIKETQIKSYKEKLTIARKEIDDEGIFQEIEKKIAQLKSIEPSSLKLLISEIDNDLSPHQLYMRAELNQIDALKKENLLYKDDKKIILTRLLELYLYTQLLLNKEIPPKDHYLEFQGQALEIKSLLAKEKSKQLALLKERKEACKPARDTVSQAEVALRKAHFTLRNIENEKVREVFETHKSKLLVLVIRLNHFLKEKADLAKINDAAKELEDYTTKIDNFCALIEEWKLTGMKLAPHVLLVDYLEVPNAP